MPALMKTRALPLTHGLTHIITDHLHVGEGGYGLGKLGGSDGARAKPFRPHHHVSWRPKLGMLARLDSPGSLRRSPSIIPIATSKGRHLFASVAILAQGASLSSLPLPALVPDWRFPPGSRDRDKSQA